MYKGEVNYNVGSNLFLVARYAHVKGGFTFVPEGGANALSFWDAGGVQHGSGDNYITDRPQDSFVVDGNYFMGNHEFKFGFAYRRATTNSQSFWGQDYYSRDDQAGYLVTEGASTYPYMIVQISPKYVSNTQSKYTNFYFGDTISLKRMTINAGIRFDHQAGSVLPANEPSPVISGEPAQFTLPAIVAPGITNALVYNLIQPRAGVTYSLTEDRKTQLRATYAMFTSQIGTGAASFMSVAQYRWFYLDALDANGDHIVQPNEILWNSYAAHIANSDFGGFNGSNPSAVATSNNKIGSYGNPKTHEFIVGIDHELMPNVGVSASYTYRRIIDFNWRPTMQVGGTSIIDGTDYVQTTACNATSAPTACGTGNLPVGIPGSPEGTYNVPYYALKTGIAYDPAKGTMYEARPDYYQTYKGFEVTATKRMANHWMARIGFSTNSWREYFTALDGQGNPTPTLSSPNISGGLVESPAAGSGKSAIYMTQPTYQLNANGAYQFKYDIDLGFSYQLRQGYPMPWWRTWTPANTTVNGQATRDALGAGKSMLLVYPDFGAARLSNVNILDLRIGKRQKIGKVTLNFDFDIFNITNAAETLGRYYSATATSTFTTIGEITQPRIMRFGLRIQF